MLKLRNILNERLLNENKKLRVFDFDDVLVKSKSFIYVKLPNGGEKILTPGEFAVYEPKRGEEFDFRDFYSLNEPRLIKGYAEILKRMINSAGTREVFILTARPVYKPVRDFLRDMGYGNIYVVALGSSNPEDKADWIEQQIKTGDYNDVYFIDDSIKNVQAVKNRLSKYPQIKSRVQHIKHR
jgi:phosphoglycolate phosphatase-like HAD superfamily hydrolase